MSDTEKWFREVALLTVSLPVCALMRFLALMQAEQDSCVTVLIHRGTKLKPYFMCASLSFVCVPAEPLEGDAADVLIRSPCRVLFSVASPSLGSTLRIRLMDASSAAASGGVRVIYLISQILHSLTGS